MPDCPTPPDADLPPLSPDIDADFTTQLRALRMQQALSDADLIVRAREDPNVFVEAIGRIEGGVWVGAQAGAHRMWQDHLTRAGASGGASTAVVLAPIGHAKSTQITRWRVVWELGRNPNLRVLLMSATTALPEKMLAGIKGDITDNAFVAAVFPRLRPGFKKGQCDWSGSSIHVDRDDNLPDASITTAGLSSKILGSRFDLIVIDDLLNTDNTLTPYMRAQVWNKVQSEVMSRRPPHLPSRAWFTGHVWTEDDAMAQACQQPGARVLRVGAKVQRSPKTGKVITSADPEWNDTLAWLPLIPSLWTHQALAARYAELRWAARHMLDNLFMRRGGGGFDPEGIARALVNGKGVTYKATWNPLATGCPTYTGVDVSSGEGEDFTVIITAVRLASGRRQILEIQSGKWDGPEIVARLQDVYRRYHSRIAVESNGVQKWLRQWLASDDAVITPVFDHATGKNKHALSLGIKHMEMELAGSGMWIFPRPLDMLAPPDADMLALCQGAMSFSKDEKHTSDWLMAWWICWRMIASEEGLSLT